MPTAISASGALLKNCFGFVERTVRPICRPGRNQRVVYNGHKRVHSLKFQSVFLPNGIMGNIYGPLGKTICTLGAFNSVFTIYPLEKGTISTDIYLNTPPPHPPPPHFRIKQPFLLCPQRKRIQDSFS